MDRTEEELKHSAVDSGSDRNGSLAAKCSVQGLSRSERDDCLDDMYDEVSEEAEDLDIWVFCLPQSEGCRPDDESCVTFGEESCSPTFTRSAGEEEEAGVMYLRSSTLSVEAENATINGDSAKDNGNELVAGEDFTDDGSSVPFVEPHVAGCPFHFRTPPGTPPGETNAARSVQDASVTRDSLGRRASLPVNSRESYIAHRDGVVQVESMEYYQSMAKKCAQGRQTETVSIASAANQITDFASQKEEVMSWIRLQLPLIQQPDLDNYSRRLIEDGFDSIQFIEQELTLNDVDFMKKAHRRVIARFIALSAVSPKKTKQNRIGGGLKNKIIGRGRSQSVRVAQNKEEEDDAGTAPTAEMMSYVRRNTAPACSQSASAETTSESKNNPTCRQGKPKSLSFTSPASSQSEKPSSDEAAQIRKPKPDSRRKPSRSRGRSRLIPKIFLTPLANELSLGYLQLRGD